MLPTITRHLIHPLHERLLGRHTIRFARELDESQWLAPDELRDLQASKLAQLLDHARRSIPFYAERLQSRVDTAASEDPIDTLRHLPLLDKQQIRSAGADITWRQCPGGLFESHTGGSSGEPLRFYLDRRRQAYDQAARIRSHAWFGVRLGDPEVYLWGSPIELNRQDRVKRWRDALFNHHLLNAFDMSALHMADYLYEIEERQPRCLFGYPSSLALLADFAMRTDSLPKLPRLGAVFVTGEVCYAHHRTLIEKAFQVPVVDGYGSREGGFIAHQCPLCNMHVTAENVIVEIIGADGNRVSPGQTGEIVITHLDNYAMPLIRYRTGDVGSLKPGRCACGRGLPMMNVVQGRTTDFLYRPDGTTMHALSIIYPLREMQGINQFRVTQKKDFGVLVEVVADDSTERISRESVMQRVQPVLGNEISLDVAVVNRIANQMSGKHRYVISHAEPNRGAQESETVNV